MNPAPSSTAIKPPVKAWPLFWVVATGVFMSTLDSSMVNIALPVIMREFHTPLPLTEWVVMIYLLTITASLLFWGHCSDRLGRGHLYSMGMLVFGLGSFFCGITPNIYGLIAFRFSQACGAAMMMSTGPAIIKENFSTSHLGRNLGLIGMAVSLGLMTGPSLGGFLIEYYSWRAIFFITVPISIFFFVLANIFLPPRPSNHQPPRLDFAGNLLWAVTVTLAVLAINIISASWPLVLFICSGTASCLTFIFFLRHEAKTSRPLLPLALFKKTYFSLAILSALISFAVLFSVILLMPFFLDHILKLPPLRIGMVMMAIPLAVLFLAPLAGWLYDFIGARYLSTAGLLVTTASLVMLGRLTTDMTPLAVAGRLALLGCGQAMFLAPNSASVLGRVRNEHAGISAGLLATARNLGMLLGVALTGLIFTHHFGRHTNGLDLKDFTDVHRQSFMTALRATYHVAAAVGLAGVIVSWLRTERKLPADDMQDGSTTEVKS